MFNERQQDKQYRQKKDLCRQNGIEAFYLEKDLYNGVQLTTTVRQDVPCNIVIENVCRKEQCPKQERNGKPSAETVCTYFFKY